MAAPFPHDQLPGDVLQAIVKHKLVESGSDYADIFNTLQIKPEHHDEIVTGIIRPLRARHARSLKSATAAMIKDLSHAFIRGYGNILYKKQANKWLVDDLQLRLVGKERLHFTQGEYGVEGPNAHFYAILEPMWWIMRGIVFELKPPVRRRGQPEKIVDVDDSDVGQGDVDTEREELLRKEKAFASRSRGRPPKAATPPAVKATSEEAPKVLFEDKQKRILSRIEQEIGVSRQNRTWEETYRMTANETDEAVQKLIARLHEIRWKSDPKAFARSWETNLGRLAEIETIDELKTSKSADPEQEQNRSKSPEPLTPDSQQKIQESLSKKAASYLANEPFNTNGPPSVIGQLGIGQTPLIPPTISLYITTSPPLHPYKDNAYHWPNAPIGITDCKKLFDGIDQRVGVRSIRGYALSYGWNDMMRSVENDDKGKGHGFSVLRQDIADAAKKGVTMWRLKVLVTGEACRYQRRV